MVEEVVEVVRVRRVPLDEYRTKSALQYSGVVMRRSLMPLETPLSPRRLIVVVVVVGCALGWLAAAES